MVRAAGDETGTVRVASTMSDGASTMIEHDDTLASQLGTMVINAEDEEEEGTMKSKALVKYTHFSGRLYRFQRKQVHVLHAGSVLRPSSTAASKAAKTLEGGGEGKADTWSHRQEASAMRRD